MDYFGMGSYVTSAFSTLRFFKDYAFAAGAYLVASRGHKAMPTLTKLDSVTHLSPLVIRVLGQNPGPFTLQGTNTYIVGNGPRRILIDTGEPNIEKYLTELKGALKEAEIEYIVITHWHHDHTGGIPGVLDQVVGKKVPVYKVQKAGNGEDVSLFEYVEDGKSISVEGATLKFVFTPGHTVDHSALWLEEEKSLFSGDCILGEGTTVFEDLHSYMDSLKKIRGLEATRIYPGHGPVIEKASDKVDEYIMHRQKREDEILAVLKKNEQISSMDITNAVYEATPLSVRLAALNNVKLVLNKLIKDGIVQKVGFELYSLTIGFNQTTEKQDDAHSRL